MSTSQPLKVRDTLQGDNSSLKISIPSPKNYISMFVVGIFVVVWIIAEIKGIQTFMLAISKSNLSEMGVSGLAGYLPGGYQFISWLFFWTVSTCFLSINFLWQLVGRENIEVADNSIRIKHAIFGFGKTNIYFANRITNMRINDLADGDFFSSARKEFWGTVDGDIVFNYDSKVARFGGGADIVEANHILKTILTRFPHFQVHKIKAG